MASAVELEKKPKLCKSLSEIKNKLNGFLVGIVDLLWRELQHEKPRKIHGFASLRYFSFALLHLVLLLQCMRESTGGEMSQDSNVPASVFRKQHNLHSSSYF